jgi:type I restriction enzyme M protein
LRPKPQVSGPTTTSQEPDLDHFAHLVANVDVAANNYALTVSSYVEHEDTAEVVDIEILNEEIAEIVAQQQVLREQVDAIVADLEDES